MVECRNARSDGIGECARVRGVRGSGSGRGGKEAVERRGTAVRADAFKELEVDLGGYAIHGLHGARSRWMRGRECAGD